jgi:hypothetical protein
MPESHSALLKPILKIPKMAQRPAAVNLGLVNQELRAQRKILQRRALPRNAGDVELK